MNQQFKFKPQFGLKPLARFSVVSVVCASALFGAHQIMAQSGKVVDAANYGGSANDVFWSTAPAADGGLFAAGYTQSTTPFNIGSWTLASNGSSDALICRFDSNGAIQWAYTFGGSLSDGFGTVAATADGGCIAVGYAASSFSGNGWSIVNQGDTDAIIFKFDKDGAVEWAHGFGGAGTDQFNGVTQMPDGGFIVVGGARSTFSGNGWTIGNNGTQDAIVFKFDATGAVEWAQNIGGNYAELFNCVAPTASGGFVAAGASVSTFSLAGWPITSQGGADLFICTFDALGAVQWAKAFGGSGQEEFLGVAQTSDGGFVAVGWSKSDFSGNGWSIANGNGQDKAVIFKLDASGTIQWAHGFGPTALSLMAQFRSVLATPDGGCVAVGNGAGTFNCGGWTFASDTTQNQQDILALKFDAAGTVLWGTCFGGPGAEFGHSVSLLTSGALVFAGSTYMTSFSGDGWSIVNNGLQDALLVWCEGTPIQYILSFHANGGDTDASPDWKQVTFNEVAGPLTGVDTGTAPTRAGYAFLGWSTASGPLNAVDFTPLTIVDASEDTPGSGTKTVYAVWHSNLIGGDGWQWIPVRLINVDTGTGEVTLKWDAQDIDARIRLAATGYEYVICVTDNLPDPLPTWKEIAGVPPIVTRFGTPGVWDKAEMPRSNFTAKSLNTDRLFFKVKARANP